MKFLSKGDTKYTSGCVDLKRICEDKHNYGKLVSFNHCFKYNVHITNFTLGIYKLSALFPFASLANRLYIVSPFKQLNKHI